MQVVDRQMKKEKKDWIFYAFLFITQKFGNSKVFTFSGLIFLVYVVLRREKMKSLRKMKEYKTMKSKREKKVL
jgi:hypothetical protein